MSMFVKKLQISFLAVVAMGFFLSSCTQSQNAQQLQKSSTFIEPYNPESQQSGELTYKSLAHWKKESITNPMRLDQYAISKDTQNAEMAVYFFPGKMRGVQANLDRWNTQFEDNESKVVHGLKQFNQGGLPITIAMYEGTYIKALRPMMPNSPKEYIKDQAMLGTIVETKDGLWFFKMLGDKALVLSESESFESFIQTFRLK